MKPKEASQVGDVGKVQKCRGAQGPIRATNQAIESGIFCVRSKNGVARTPVEKAEGDQPFDMSN